MVGAWIHCLVGCVLLGSGLQSQVVALPPAGRTDAAAQEIADLAREVRQAADPQDPFARPEFGLDASIQRRWFAFSWRHGMQPQDAPGWEDLRSAAGKLIERQGASDDPAPPKPWVDPEAILWRALLLDMSGHPAEAQALLATIRRGNWAFDGCTGCEARGNMRDTRLRAAIAERLGDPATALRWQLDACLDSWEPFVWTDPELLWGYCAHLLSLCGRDEEAVTLWGALAHLQPDTDAARLAQSELQQRGMTAVARTASLYTLNLWGRDGAIASVFVIGREGDPLSYRTVAARMSVDEYGHGGPVLCPGDVGFDLPVRRGLERMLAGADLVGVGRALIALHGTGASTRHLLLPFLARLETHEPDPRADWGVTWGRIDPDEPLRVILGDGPDRSLVKGLDGPALAQAWFSWLLEH